MAALLLVLGIHFFLTPTNERHLPNERYPDQKMKRQCGKLNSAIQQHVRGLGRLGHVLLLDREHGRVVAHVARFPSLSACRVVPAKVRPLVCPSTGCIACTCVLWP